MRIRKRAIGLVLIGLISYLVFLIVHFPAAQAYALFGGNLPLKAFGISGTVWSGQAAVVQVEQQRLEALQWTLQPASLLRARAAVDVQARVPGGSLSGHVQAGRTATRAQNLRVDLPATQLLQLAGIRLPVRIDGRFDISMRELALHEGQLTHAVGMVSWRDAMVNLGRPLPLGNMNLRLQPGSNNETHGTLVNDGGPIDITQGDLRIAPSGEFVMMLTVQARPGAADSDAGSTMRLVGIPTDGTPVRARLIGSLDGSGVKLEPVQ
jgi:general secretion pathway protein N